MVMQAMRSARARRGSSGSGVGTESGWESDWESDWESADRAVARTDEEGIESSMAATAQGDEADHAGRLRRGLPRDLGGVALGDFGIESSYLTFSFCCPRCRMIPEELIHRHCDRHGRSDTDRTSPPGSSRRAEQRKSRVIHGQRDNKGYSKGNIPNPLWFGLNTQLVCSVQLPSNPAQSVRKARRFRPIL
jgi:hypothetical protein